MRKRSAPFVCKCADSFLVHRVTEFTEELAEASIAHVLRVETLVLVTSSHRVQGTQELHVFLFYLFIFLRTKWPKVKTQGQQRS